MGIYEDIKVTVDGRVATITLNRPDVLNAMRMKTKAELKDAFEKLNEDESVWGVMITGAGRAFAAGSDVHEISINRSGRETEEMSLDAHVLMNEIENMDKPVVAVINGYALGGGLELALACDLRVMSTKAKVGVPEVDLGVAPCYGGTQRLPRLIGPARAKDLLFTGRHVDAEEALKIGLVDRIAEPEELFEKAKELMDQIIEKAPIAVRYCKYCVNKGMEMSLKDGLAYEAEAAGVLVETEDAKEGVRSFFDKRKPEFRNK